MLVSVVIPSYNHHEYVLQAIASVLDQDWPDIDLIVIDDGSTDGSAELIQELYEKRGGFRFVKRENQGLIKTLNQGLSLARGDYFCELASDDFFPADSIRKRVMAMQQKPGCAVVFADGVLIAGEVTTGQTLVRDKHRNMFAAEDPIPHMLQGALPVFSTGLFLTDALRNIGGFDDSSYQYYEDLEIPLRLCAMSKIDFLDDTVIYRRDHDTNVSKTTHHIRTEKIKCLLKLHNDSQFFPYRTLVSTQLRREYLKLGRCLLNVSRGSPEDHDIFQDGWRYAWKDPRFFFYLLLVAIIRRKRNIES